MSQVPFNVNPLDFSKELALLQNSDFESISRKEGFVMGQKIWSHYKKGITASAEQIIGIIAGLKSGEQKDVDLGDSSNQDLINRLHWDIYNR